MNKDRARADDMVKDLGSKNDKSFWKKLSKINRKLLPLTNVLNGCHGEKDIANLFCWDHCETLSNCVKSDKCYAEIIDFLSSGKNIKIYVFTHVRLKKARHPPHFVKLVAMMVRLQSILYLTTEAFVYNYISMLYSSMLSHGYLPEEFMK